MPACNSARKIRTVRLTIWSGFRPISSSYYRGAKGVFILYSIYDRESFEHVSRWLTQFEESASSDCCPFIIGTKNDLSNRRVSFEEAKALADQKGLTFFETSSKDNVNISEAFYELALQMLSRAENSKSQNQNSSNNSNVPSSNPNNSNISLEDIQTETKTRTHSIFNLSTIKSDVEAIKTLYKRLGFFKAIVDAKESLNKIIRLKNELEKIKFDYYKEIKNQIIKPNDL